jgi:uncharacterized membrane protein
VTGASGGRRWIGAVVAIFALAGIAISVYLTEVHYAGIPLACSQTGFVNCDAVIGSRYGTIGSTGIPVAAAGIGWFAVSAALAVGLLLKPEVRSLPWLLATWSGLAMVVVLYLVFVEVVTLGAVCAWCTSAHVLVLLTLLLAIYEIGSSGRAAAEERPTV